MLLFLCLVVGASVAATLTVLGYEVLDRLHVKAVRTEGRKIGLGDNGGGWRV